MIGRPVSMHAMRGISAHSNGFHTCRALHLLQILLGSIDAPGGFRYKAPFPKPIPCFPKPSGHETVPGEPLEGSPLGMPTEPEDLLVEPDGTPKRIDKAFSRSEEQTSELQSLMRHSYAVFCLQKKQT